VCLCSDGVWWRPLASVSAGNPRDIFVYFRPLGFFAKFPGQLFSHVFRVVSKFVYSEHLQQHFYISPQFVKTTILAIRNQNAAPVAFV
jgi:hypothetical protein